MPSHSILLFFILGFILSVFCALAVPDAAFNAPLALAAVQGESQPEGSGGADLNTLTAGKLFLCFDPSFVCLFVCLSPALSVAIL